jgi:hypothetical protein
MSEPKIIYTINKNRNRTSIYLERRQSMRLAKIAFAFGYIQCRGVGVGTVGSISRLMRAIADGEIELRKK